MHFFNRQTRTVLLFSIIQVKLLNEVILAILYLVFRELVTKFLLSESCLNFVSPGVKANRATYNSAKNIRLRNRLPFLQSKNWKKRTHTNLVYDSIRCFVSSLSIAFTRLQNNDRREFAPNKLAVRESTRHNSIQRAVQFD